jgi:hypothetical protein
MPKLIARGPLLITESVEEFDALLAELKDEIKPNGVIEQIYLYDLAYIILEILRMRRFRSATINAKFRDALTHLLERLLVPQGMFVNTGIQTKAKLLAAGWFADEEGRQDVLTILRRFKLDESNIEAEAIRLAWSDLESVDKMQASLNSRFDKLLRNLANFRSEFGKLVRQKSDRILESDEPIQLESDSVGSLAVGE